MNTTLRTARLRTLAIGGAIAVTAVTVTTVFSSLAVTQPDETAQKLSAESSPTQEDTTLHVHDPRRANPFTDRSLNTQDNPAGETETNFIPLPSNQGPPPELYVETFTEEENALLNSDEPTHVEVDPYTGDIISVEKREDHSIPANFGGTTHLR